MSNTPVYIKEIVIENYKCFQGKHKFFFVDKKDKWCQWNVFLGNNNAGKTSILKAIASFNSTFNLIFHSFPLDKIEYGLDNSGSGLFLKYENTMLNLKPILPENFSNVQTYSWQLFGNNSLCQAYGVIRTIDTKGINDNKNYTHTDNLFLNSNLINFEDWLWQLNSAANNKDAGKDIRKNAADKKDLLIEILKSDIFPEISNIQFVSDEKLNNYIKYQTKDGWYILSELGYGYQSMLSWLMDFAKKLFDRYPDSENPLKEPAVLLVDEIDLHLHPTWQRKIIKYLSDLFPQTQFIVTTHSPFILQSMENVNLYTLRREGDHTISTHLGNQSFVGWRIEEILREIMDLGDDINTDYYQNLSDKFDKALDDDDYKTAKEAYEELSKILHPTSSKRKLMEIQISQIIPSND
ncbi:MAG: AAA family ATPase [Candidatus Symbiothrix sp.]|jgi:predicted ATP-binding protein involved in virulence|nr:AAA family ATPase [Candidatus Symbiothrix sp.]